MWKLSLTLFALAVSTSPTGGDRNACKTSYQVYGEFHQVIKFVNKTICGNRFSEDCLALYLQDFSAIAPYILQTTNASTFRPKNCNRRIFDATSASSDQVFELDCASSTLKPNPFENLGSVVELNLSRIEFTEVAGYLLPHTSKLERLIISEVNITTINSNIFSKISQGLQELSLGFNNLEMIEGKSFRKFDRLKRLSIRNNHISDLRSDAFEGLNELTHLMLENNDITALREDTFRPLTELRVVNLRNNSISEIEEETFSSWNIYILDLSHNELEDLPAGVFKSLRNLHSLDLSSNKISTLTRNLFEGLQNPDLNLDLSFNKIYRIDPGVFRGVHISSLKLDHNKLKVIEPDSFYDSYIIECLDLSANADIEIKRYAFRNSSVGCIKLL